MTRQSPASSDHYTIISADTHAGGSHAAYREYLDSKHLEEFDAWRAKYRNPFRDLEPGDNRRLRNWDNELRVTQQEADGVVGEVIFPNTVPPFFPSFVLFASPPKPEDYELRLAGVRAHNRWLTDWCDEYRWQRAGIGQVFLNSIDDAIEDVKWIKDHGLRGGLLLPNIPPDVTWIAPLHDPVYDPFWEICQDLEVPVNTHGGTGTPNYGKSPAADLLYVKENGFFSKRPLVQLTLGGVFERFPRLRFAITEQGCSWVPQMLHELDEVLEKARTGKRGELRFDKETVLPRSGTEYFRQNCWLGVSFPNKADTAAMNEIGIQRCMWGSDYPHDEGTFPYTREHLRQIFSQEDPKNLQRILGGNAAELYDFDLDKLAPLADRIGPTVEDIARPLVDLPESPNDALLRGAA